MFYAIALAESGRAVAQRGSIRPWPWTLNVHGEGRYYASRSAATKALYEAIAAGRVSVDIGPMQVNWRYHGAAFPSLDAALDPYRNLSVAAAILARCYRQRREWWAAVGCYHAPNNPSRAARYRARVKKHWQALQAPATAG